MDSSGWCPTVCQYEDRSLTEKIRNDPKTWPSHPKRVVEIVTTTTVSKRVVDEKVRAPKCNKCFDSGLDYNREDCDHKP